MSDEQKKQPPEKTAESLLEVVRQLAAELQPGRKHLLSVTLDSLLDRDLGLDSLARVELLIRIERTFEVMLSEQVLAGAETPRDLLRAVLSGSPKRPRITPDQVKPAALEKADAAAHGAQTLVEVLDRHVLTHPDRPHILLYGEADHPEEITYRSLKQGAEAVAAGLRQKNIEPGQTVAIMLPTSREYFFSFFGILLGGGIPVPLYPPVRPTQIEEHLRRHRGILGNAQATMLITVPEAQQVAHLLKAQVEGLRNVVTVQELTSGAGEFNALPLQPQDIAFLQYTSGSTGAPKGVVLTHANLLANIRAMGEAVQADSTDVFVSWLPLYHDMGLIGAWFGSLYYACQMVLMSPLAFLARPEQWLWTIHRHRGTLSPSPNFGYELCLRKIDDRDIKGLDLSSWRIAFNGAEPVSPETVRHFSERFRHYGFRPKAMTPVYGLAESSVGLAFPPPDRGPVIDRIRREPLISSGQAMPALETDTKALRFVACGRPLPGHQIRIVDPTDRELPERQEGRLQFRGPSVTSGYFRNPEETRRLFHGDWLDSGDLAYMAGGDVYLTSRVKDIIIRGGRNIYPYELEEAVGEIPGIRKGCVAVFGSTDPASGTERLVVLAETRETDSETIKQLRTSIINVAVDLLAMPPDDVVIAPSHTVLKTSSGKIRRAASREVYEKGRIGKRQRAVWWQLTRLALGGLLPQLRRARRMVTDVLYASYAWTLFGLVAPVTWVLVALLPRSGWRWTVARGSMRLLACLSQTPIVVYGLDNLPKDRNIVLVANHLSYLDGFVLVAALPIEFGFVAKVELADYFTIRLLLSRMDVEFIERFDIERGVADARRVTQAAARGKSLLFFPEGTFQRMPGLLPFHMGAFVTAAEAGMPVVPVTIRGTRSKLRSGSFLPRRGAVSVTVGKPITPGGSNWAAAIELRDATRADILRHCGEPEQ
ncbi:MAG: AMP-binding protein [Thermodesulfobacteriota bacterium]|nr:AMP-binding protein [Thermodesulfobacteriota bacterium]